MASVNGKLIVSQAEAVTAFAFLLELRVVGSSGKEVFEGIPQLDNRHLWSIFGDF